MELGLEKQTGTVLDIQRLSTEDGPGIRTTVFLKGCSLACKWCHNPESIKFSPQVQWIEASRCIECGLCVSACPIEGLVLTEGQIVIDREKCEACGTCVGVCPTAALEIKGEVKDAAGLARELCKDKSFFAKNGGVTFSGGEALMQADFVASTLKLLREEGVHTAVDTAGLVSRSSIEAVLPFADLVLYDIKLVDSGLHKRFTGAENGIILENARFLAEYHREHAAPEIWIRTPIIPGATDFLENISGIGAFIAENMDGCVSRWELCAFNNLCASKYKRLGMEWDYLSAAKIEKQTMDELTEVAKRSGVDPDIVLWTGSTKLDEK